MSDQLSIVIPTWNGRDLLARFLPSVLAAAPEAEVVVSDDGSTDGTQAWLAEHYPGIRVARSECNRGFAPAANAGVAAATSELVVLLNNDVELTPDCLVHVSAWFADPGLFGVTFRALDLPEMVFSTGGKLGRWRRGFWETWRNYDGLEPGASFMLVGGFCAFRRSVFLDLGGFGEIFAPYYSEDVDLSYRARKRGWNLAYEPRALLHHAPSSSVRRHRARFRRQITIERNRLLLHWRNLDRPRLVTHLLWAHLLLIQALFTANFAYHAGYAQALARWRRVRSFRAQERRHWRRSDRELELSSGQTSLPQPASMPE